VRPFAGETVYAILMAVTTRTPDAPNTLNPELPLHLSSVIRALMEKTADARPKSAAEVALALDLPDNVTPWESLGTTEVIVSVPKAAPTPKKPAPRWKRAAIAVGLLATVVAASVIVIVRDKDGKIVGQFTVPEGSSVEVKPGAPEPQPVPPVAATPDRRAAEYVLKLGGTVRVNGENRDIKAVADLPNGPFSLQWVKLIKSKEVTDAGLANFKGCTRLKYLDLHETRVSDAALANFSECTELVYIDLNQTGVTDAGFAHFKGNKGVRWLDLCENPGITDAALAHLRGTKVVTHLQLYNTAVTDTTLSYFKDCDNLMLLNVGGKTRVTDAGLVHFKGCRNVMFLNLSHTAVTDEGLKNFKDCRSLSDILLVSTSVTKAGVMPFTSRQGWTLIHLQRTRVTQTEIADLAKAAPQWTIFHDGGPTIDPVNAVPPDRTAAERVLFLGGVVRVHGDAREIRTAADLPATGFRLTEASLSQSILFRELELEMFKGCKNLKSLDASNTAVTDAVLPNLNDCNELVHLDLRRTKVTQAGVTALATALPRCRIIWDGGTIDPKVK
jgi:eukaryotic-like serine/threonine-protein kinase